MANRYHIIKQGKAVIIELQIPHTIEAVEFDGINSQLSTDIGQYSGHHFVLDLQHVQYVGSALLGLMINVRTHVRAIKGTLCMCRIDPYLIKVIKLGSMERLFTIHDTREEALGTKP